MGRQGYRKKPRDNRNRLSDSKKKKARIEVAKALDDFSKLDATKLDQGALDFKRGKLLKFVCEQGFGTNSTYFSRLDVIYSAKLGQIPKQTVEELQEPSITQEKDKKQKTNYVGILETNRRLYRVRVKWYGDYFIISRAYHHNPKYFKPEERLYVFWKFNKEGRISSIDMLLIPYQNVCYTVLEVEDSLKPPLTWNARKAKYKGFPPQAGIIHSLLGANDVVRRYEGLINVGHTFVQITIGMLNKGGGIIRDKRRDIPEEHLQQIIYNDSLITMMNKAGSILTSVKPAGLEGCLTVFYE